jgi:hypothetical protein
MTDNKRGEHLFMFSVLVEWGRGGGGGLRCKYIGESNTSPVLREVATPVWRSLYVE